MRNADFQARHQASLAVAQKERRHRSRSYEVLEGSPEGRALLREVLVPFRAALVAAQELKQGKPPQEVRAVFSRLPVDVVALRVVQSVLATLVLRRDSPHQAPKRTLQAAARLVGKDLAREIMLDLAYRSKEHGQSLTRFARVLHQRQSSPSRVARHLLEDVQKFRAAGWNPPGLLSDFEQSKAGAWFILVLDRSAGLVKIAAVQAGPFKRSVLEFSEQAHDWLSRLRELAWLSEGYHVPCLDFPMEREDFDTGGNPDRPSQLVVLRAGVDREAYQDLYRAGALYPVQDACERLERVPFIVNQAVLADLRDHWDRDESPMLPDMRLVPEPIYDPAEEDQAARKEAWRARLRAQGDNCGATDRRLGVARNLAIAESLGEARFYMPHQADFRGRLYPVPAWLQPQGRDVSRALLDFADQPHFSIGSQAAGWFFYAGTQLLLGSKTFQVFDSFDAAIEAAYKGFPGLDARPELADKPWQFSRWQRDAEALRRVGQVATGSWVQFDAHASAFQWLAVLTGSARLAELTGLSTGRPADLYASFARMAAEEIPRMAAKSEQDRADLEELLVWLNGVPREFGKAVLMRRALGSAFFPTVNEVHKLIGERLAGAESPLRDAERAGSLLGSRLYQLSKTYLPELEAVRAWISGLFSGIDARLGEGTPLAWTMPDGFVVQPSYGEWQAKTVALRSGGYAKSLSLGSPSGTKVDRRKERGAFLPNLIHSWDAYLVRRVTKACSAPLVTIHDCFATPPFGAQDLYRVLSQEMMEAERCLRAWAQLDLDKLRPAERALVVTNPSYAFN
jgi:DNA-directed RNA polymerase, mitochondrial